MADVLSMAEIEAQCDSEWVLIADPELDEALDVKSGRLVFHSPDRDEVYRRAKDLKAKRIAVFFIGDIPEDMAILL